MIACADDYLSDHVMKVLVDGKEMQDVYLADEVNGFVEVISGFNDAKKDFDSIRLHGKVEIIFGPKRL